MNLIDIYLQRHQITRYDVSQRSGISQQTLYSANKKDAKSYSGKVLIALGQATGDTAGEVLDALLTIEREGALLQVFTFAELKEAVDSQSPRFLVVGPFLETVKAYKKSQLSEADRLGFDLGSAGSGGLFEFLINQLWIILDKNPDKASLRLQDKVVKLYDIKLINKQTAELSLRSLNY